MVAPETELEIVRFTYPSKIVVSVTVFARENVGAGSWLSVSSTPCTLPTIGVGLVG